MCVRVGMRVHMCAKASSLLGVIVSLIHSSINTELIRFNLAAQPPVLSLNIFFYSLSLYSHLAVYPLSSPPISFLLSSLGALPFRLLYIVLFSAAPPPIFTPLSYTSLCFPSSVTQSNKICLLRGGCVHNQAKHFDLYLLLPCSCSLCNYTFKIVENTVDTFFCDLEINLSSKAKQDDGSCWDMRVKWCNMCPGFYSSHV